MIDCMTGVYELEAVTEIRKFVEAQQCIHASPSPFAQQAHSGSPQEFLHEEPSRWQQVAGGQQQLEQVDELLDEDVFGLMPALQGEKH